MAGRGRLLYLVLKSLAGLDGTGSPGPGKLQLEKNLDATADWICLAHAKSGDGGISKGYDALRGSWYPSYPETTGYTIPTLLNLADALGRSELRTLALSLAEYLLDAVTPEGGVAHWAASKPEPIVFDTGQVVFGWVAAYRATGDSRYLLAAERAGQWLVSVQHPSGSWKKHQYLGVEKVIDTRVAWALLELYKHTRQPDLMTCAIRSLEWAIRQQEENGWFRHCAFVPNKDPFTHAIAYTAEGLFECGELLEEVRYIRAARLTADALRKRLHPDGRLMSTFSAGWLETSRSCCLTGNCQMSMLWLRLYQHSNNRAYFDAAEGSIRFVAGTQELGAVEAEIRGAIAGSYPIYGIYERLKYPNWAAKFFADSLLAFSRVQKSRELYPYKG